jgi:acetyl esterase/lipase
MAAFLRAGLLTFVMLIAFSAQAQSDERDPPSDLGVLPVLYEVAGMDDVRVERDIVFKQVDDFELLMDVYLPATEGEPYPVVLISTGGVFPPPEAHLKDWAQFQSWGRLIAASGMAAVMFQHSNTEGAAPADVQQDVDDAVAYMVAHADDWQLDSSRVCYMGFSGFAPFILTVAFRDGARCAVGYYPLLVLEDDENSSPLHYVETQDPDSLPPFPLVNPMQDEHVTLPRLLDQFVQVAIEREIGKIYIQHPTGAHF